MKKILAIIFIALLADSQVYATSSYHVCIQNTASIPLMTVLGNFNNSQTTKLIPGIIPLNSGNNWANYCFYVDPSDAADGVGVTFTLVMPLGNMQPLVVQNANIWDPASGDNTYSGNGENGYLYRWISPGGGNYVVKVCDPGTVSC